MSWDSTKTKEQLEKEKSLVPHRPKHKMPEKLTCNARLYFSNVLLLGWQSNTLLTLTLYHLHLTICWLTSCKGTGKVGSLNSLVNLQELAVPSTQEPGKNKAQNE